MMSRVTAGVQSIKFIRSRAGQVALAASAGLHVGLFIAISASILSSLGAVALVPMLYLLGRFIHRGLRSTPSAGSIHDLIEFERRDLIERATSALKSTAEPGNIEWGVFFLRAEILGKPGKEKERLKQIGKELLNFDKVPGKKLEEISIKAKNALGDESNDPTQRFQKLFDFLYPEFLTNYEKEQGDLYGLLVGGKKSCEAQAKFLMSLMPEKDQEWEPAVALFHNHIEIVLFKRTTGEVYDTIERKISDDYPTAIFHRNLFFYAYLKGMGIEPPIQAEELLLKDLPSWVQVSEGQQAGTSSLFNYNVGMALPALPQYERGQASSSSSYNGEPSEAPSREPFSFWNLLAPGYLSAHITDNWLNALVGALMIGSLSYLGYRIVDENLVDDIYQTYKEYILCKRACVYASLKTGVPVPYTFFRHNNQVDFTRCEPSFWDSRLRYEERLKPVIGEMTQRLEAGLVKVQKVGDKLETANPKGLIEFEGAIARARDTWKTFGYQLATHTFNRVIRDKRFTISREFGKNSWIRDGWNLGLPVHSADFVWELRPYHRLIDIRKDTIPKLFGSIKGAQNLNSLSQPELVQVVKSLSFLELVHAIIYLESVPYGPALVADGQPDGIRDSKNRDGRDRVNIQGNKGKDDRSKKGTAFKEEEAQAKRMGENILRGREIDKDKQNQTGVRLQNGKGLTVDLPHDLKSYVFGETILRGNKNGKDIKDQSGNHTPGKSTFPKTRGHILLDRRRQETTYEVELVDMRPELSRARTFPLPQQLLNEALESPRRILVQETKRAPKLSSVPWDFLVRFMEAIRSVYPEQADSLTWRIKTRLSQNPEARECLRRLGEDVNDYENKVHEGGFLK